MSKTEFEMTASVDQVQYAQFCNSGSQYTNESDQVPIQTSRKEFLIKFYATSLISFTITLCIFLCAFSDALIQIVIVFSFRYYPGYDISFETYQSYYKEEKSDQEYLEYKQSNIQLVSTKRWTFYLFFWLLIANALIILLGRNFRTIVAHQKKLFYSQTILIGLTLMGVAGHERDSFWAWRKRCYIIICTLSGFMLNSIISILLIKFKNVEQCHHSKYVLQICFIMNLILVLGFEQVEGYVFLSEIFIIYVLYYYNQLNTSLLKEPETLPEYQNIIQIIKNHQKPQEQQKELSATEILQKNPDYIVVNKKYTLTFIGVIVTGILIYFSITSYNPIFKILLIFGSSQILGLAFDTQVASKTLQGQDHYYAASLQFVDLLFPLKNFISCGEY